MRPAREAALADEDGRRNTNGTQNQRLRCVGRFRQRDGWLRQPSVARSAFFVSFVSFFVAFVVKLFVSAGFAGSALKTWARMQRDSVRC